MTDTITTTEFPVGAKVTSTTYPFGNPGKVGTVVETPEGYTSFGGLAVDFGDEAVAAYGKGIYNVPATDLTVADAEPTVAPDALTAQPGGLTADLESQVSRLTTTVEDLRNRLLLAQQNVNARSRDLDEFKDKVRAAVIREAESRGWCNEADEWLKELGLPGRERNWSVPVDVTVTHRVYVTAQGVDADEAAATITDDEVTDAVYSETGVRIGYMDNYDWDTQPWDADETD